MEDREFKDEVQTIEAFTEDMEKYPGYFDFYWDEKRGTVWLEIDKFDEEFLYLDSLTAGLGSNDVGLDRNQMGETRIVKFSRSGPKVLMVQPNYSFRAISENPYERKAVDEAFVKSVIWGFEVEVEEDERVLVDATTFIIRDAKGVRKTLKEKEQGEYELNEKRCMVYLPGTKNFPMNTEFEAVLTFEGKEPGKYIESVAPNPHSLTLRQHHSLVQLPDDEYEPRIYDIRSSFFGISYKDYASPVDEPLEKRFICRHRLRKKDPSAEISEPVEPITYYVDRGVPEPIRSALIEGASWWNQAFESIGYRDAFRVEVLPEDAHPLDIRYNVINWVHRSTRGWSYGMSIRDPRTGEIVKGNVALGSLRIRQDFLIAEGLAANYEDEGTSEMMEMALARIRQLSVHEVGHTLGLGHNYASNVNDRASVMDYPAPLVKIGEDGSLDLSDAYEEGVGEWDKVSIAYGYQDFPPDLDEEDELNSILEEAFTRGLYFAPSQDAGPESANPLAASWVNGKDALDEFERIMKVRKIALESFGEEKIHIGRPMAELEDVLVPLYLLHRYQMEAVASVLGGLYYHHKVRGGVQKSPEFIPAEEQIRALDLLLKAVEPENLAIDERILSIIPPRPQGYTDGKDLFPGRTGLPFDSLAAAETSAKLCIDLLLNTARASRLVEYHSRRPELPGLSVVLEELLNSTWKSTHSNARYQEIQMIVDNIVLYKMMTIANDDDAALGVREILYSKLDELMRWLNEKIDSVEDNRQRSHYLWGASMIQRFKENPEKVNLTEPLKPPMGPPI